MNLPLSDNGGISNSTSFSRVGIQGDAIASTPLYLKENSDGMAAFPFYRRIVMGYPPLQSM